MRPSVPRMPSRCIRRIRVETVKVAVPRGKRISAETEARVPKRASISPTAETLSGSSAKASRAMWVM